MAAFLIVGLGNPGEKYQQTRHNFGFLVLDKLASEVAITFERIASLPAMVGAGDCGGHTLYLAKPQTYMNQSGKAVAALARFFCLDDPERIVVIHDDLDLPFGTVKVKRNGGHGGHNGVRSIISSLETTAFLRVRLGIGQAEKPTDVIQHVLSPFDPDELKIVVDIVRRGSEAVKMIVISGVESAMNSFNRTV